MSTGTWQGHAQRSRSIPTTVSLDTFWRSKRHSTIGKPCKTPVARTPATRFGRAKLITLIRANLCGVFTGCRVTQTKGKIAERSSSGNPGLPMPSKSSGYYAENLSDKLSVVLIQ